MRHSCIALMLLGCVLASGCDPFKEQREAAAERKRIECTDKICDGDVEPDIDRTKLVAFKKNGQWYTGPREYGHPAFGAIAFYWPSKAPSHDVTAASAAPEIRFGPQGQVVNGYDHLVEIFLTGRARWPDPKAERPWEGRGWEGRFEELQSQGLRIEREQLNPELVRVRFFDSQGKQHRHEFFLATRQSRVRGNGAPGVACDPPNQLPNALPRCTGGFFWQEDVYADFRFHAQHAKDWPAIHQEIVRVLNLLKKVPQ